MFAFDSWAFLGLLNAQTLLCSRIIERITVLGSHIPSFLILGTAAISSLLSAANITDLVYILSHGCLLYKGGLGHNQYTQISIKEKPLPVESLLPGP